jgi:phenylacetate-CoA ligase
MIAQAVGLRPWRSPADLVSYQDRRLRSLIDHAYTRVPYYRELLDRHDIDPSRIRGLADLERVPVSSKDDLRRQPLQNILASGRNPRRLQRIQTTGSTGEPFVLYREPVAKRMHQLFWLRATRRRAPPW